MIRNMIRMSELLRFVYAGLLAAALALAMGPMASSISVAQPAIGEVPFGDKVGPAVTNYNRLRPRIATAGLLKDGAVGELKALGFATILDLRGPEEGTDAERKAVEAAGLHYANIPVTDILPSDAQVTEFSRVVEDAKVLPLMVHCGSGNRVGTMWTLYRLQKGIPFAIAVEEGRTTGMQPSREDAIRKRFGQPLLAR
jgi:uncharacterized protein (TIGR01244 family)